MSPKQATADLKAQKDRAILEAYDSAKKAGEIISQLNEVKRMAEAEKKRINDELTVIISALSEKRIALESEVAILERKRANALKPIDKERNEVKDARNALQCEIEAIGKVSEAIEAAKLSLKNDRELLEKREQDLNLREQVLIVAETKFANDKKRIMATLDRREEKVEKQLSDIAKREDGIKAREFYFADVMRNAKAELSACEEARKDIARREKKLEYKEQILANAYKEAKTKKII